jgi:hypothetical protein
VRCRREARHVDTDLRDERLRRDVGNTRHRYEELSGLTKGGEAFAHLRVDRSDRAIERVELIEMELQKKLVRPTNVATQRLEDGLA